MARYQVRLLPPGDGACMDAGHEAATCATVRIEGEDSDCLAVRPWPARQSLQQPVLFTVEASTPYAALDQAVLALQGETSAAGARLPAAAPGIPAAR